MTATPQDAPRGTRIRESYAARKQREAIRDNIRDIAWDIAEHVAGANMAAVESDANGWPRFSHIGTSPPRCQCGLYLTPMPRLIKRFGWLPLWVCGICSLETIVKDLGPAILAEARIQSDEALPEPRP